MKSGFWFFGVAAAAGLTHLAVFFLIERFLPTVLPELANFSVLCGFYYQFYGASQPQFQRHDQLS